MSRLFPWLVSFTLMLAAHAQTQSVKCPVKADTWVETPPSRRAPNSPAVVNHGAEPQLVINGRAAFAILQFDLSAAAGMKVEKAVLRVHQAAGLTPLSAVGISTISGSGNWTEGQEKNNPATAGAATYSFAQAERQPWAYPGSDLTDVTFGLGGSLYAYPRARAVSGGWFEIDVPAGLVSALATGDQFGWMLTDEKGQTRTRHILSSREGEFPPMLIVEGSRRDRTPPGPVHSLKAGSGVQASSPDEARALGRTTLGVGSVVLHFGRAGDDQGQGVAAKYELRYSRQPIDSRNFQSATSAPRWWLDPLAPKPSWAATQNSLRDEVNAIAENLEPAAVYYFAARAQDASGNVGPVSPLGQYRAYSRNFPELPAQPAGSAISSSGAAPKVKDVAVWAVPEMMKVDPKTGSLLERSEPLDYRTHNRIWNAVTSTVRLTGSRNEFVAFQLAIESLAPLHAVEVRVAKKPFATGKARMPDVFRESGGVQCYREWFVPDDKDASPTRPWYADALVPIAVPFDLPAADNAVPGQTVQPVFVDLYIPRGAEPGLHTGELNVRDGSGFAKTIRIEIEVLPLNLPDKLNFNVDLNAYGGVSSGYDMPRGTPEYRDLLRSYHRMAHLHRTNLNILGYTQTGTVEPGQAPPLSGEGAGTRVMSWSDWDSHFGPLLDGSAFADLPRASVPVPNVYLAFFENWPGDLRKSYRYNNYPDPRTTEDYTELIARHALEAAPIEDSFSKDYQDRFSAVLEQFAEHFRERNWLQTKYQVYLNNKYYNKDPGRTGKSSSLTWWLLDEPNHRDDYRAISFFSALTKRALAKYPDVPILFRADISYVEFIRDLLVGQLDLTCSSPHFYTKNRLLMDHRERTGKTHWNYASTNHPKDTNVTMRAWCWRAWMLGADGLLPWNSVRGADAWNRAEPLTVFYPGKKFGRNEPFASLRLKAYRRGQQDIEYLMMLARKSGWDRDAVTRAVAASAKLTGGIEQRFEEDAGVVSLSGPDDVLLDNLRLRVAAALMRP
ncbi:MAG TPA: hypothetical protein VMZ52_16425 [Bryobacteraceae bacterium]|nr:hypothetical protein [Bryobacteraceae bacterium]